MMFCLKILLLLVLSFMTHAEQTAVPPASKSNPDAQIYTKESSDNVAALNKAAEVLRDPTKALPFPEDLLINLLFRSKKLLSMKIILKVIC
jgi:hypothetical protein